MAAVCAAGPDPIMTSFECIFLLVTLGRAELVAPVSRDRKDAAVIGIIIEERSDESSGLRNVEENSLAVGVEKFWSACF